MTLTTGLSTAKDRILAMELLAVSGSKAAGHASFKYQTGFPYWTNRLGNVPTAPERGALFYRWSIPLTARLLVGYSGQGWQDEYENTLQFTYIPDVLTYFTARNRLVYQAGQSPPTHWETESFNIRTTGLQQFVLPDGSFYVGTEFPMTLVFEVPIEME